MIEFARTCSAIAGTASKLEKIALVAAYLRELDNADLAAAARFFTGNPFPQRDERSLAVGGRTIVEAAQAVWGIDDAALSASYRATGDLGAALGPFVRPSVDLGLFRETLTPAGLYALLVEIADASGKNAQRRRRILCERIFAACSGPLEATYVIKIMTGELRIGLREGLVVDAVAAAFARDPRAVRRAASAAGDLGAVATAAKHDTLDQVTIAYHAPIAFMLASPIAYGSEYKDLATASWLVEDKYDGIRVQAHVTPERVSLFSRTLNDVAASYPEVVDALRAIPGSFALDGEVVAVRNGRVLPFRYLQGRLQRKDVSPDLLDEIPVRYVAFDALARDDAFFLDLPLEERRARLAELIGGSTGALELAPWTALEAGAAAETIHERFEDSRLRGNEGLVFKRTDAPYTPGRRGKAWLKLKRELATLDCVVVGVERGHGRRAQVLSDYTFAVRDGEGLAVIGKAYSGLTDVEIAEMTAWFEAHRLPPPQAREAYARLGLSRREIVVEPRVVVEIAFDIVQRSELHASGYALRFPRIVRLRPDKPPEEADTLERVAEIYAEMLEREGIGEPG
ncbi:MAG TPA: ATP-dependent DNA ligase [Candidatus Acidoferrum sp.]|jgi:DNA ligase-1|nr:ATP-dependent DNA ligase [Candidatus Acidoferrum sp.]